MAFDIEDEDLLFAIAIGGAKVALTAEGKPYDAMLMISDHVGNAVSIKVKSRELLALGHVLISLADQL